ncbi:hypothetical protein ACP3W2_27535, partial [Salmonella enterica]|uniref:hypothetical protein n=1 Tax=Salmonella enterica TaxID=28901 RepID=UPI003CEDC9E9
GEVREAFLLLTSEIFGQPVLIFTDCLQLALDALVIFKAACNRRWAAAADAVTNGRLAVCQRPA